MELAREDQHADAAEHALDDRWGDGAKPTTETPDPSEHLKYAANEHGEGECGEPEVFDDAPHEDGETRGGPADLKRLPGECADHNAPDDAAGQTERRRRPGCDGDTHTQRQCHQEDDDRGHEVVAHEVLEAHPDTLPSILPSLRTERQKAKADSRFSLVWLSWTALRRA